MRIFLVLLFPLSVCIPQFAEIPLPPVDDSLFRVTFTDPMHGWISGTKGTILRTIDGGVNWEKLPPPMVGSNLEEIRFYQGNYGIAYVSSLKDSFDNRLYRTLDGGETWQRIPMPDSTHIAPVTYGAPVHATAPDHLVYLGSRSWHMGDGPRHNEIFMSSTSDAGQTWTYTQWAVPFTMTMHYFWAIDTTASAMLDGGMGGEMFPHDSQIRKTYDFGETWASKVVIYEPMCGLEFTDAKRGVAFFTDERCGFMTTFDGGETWKQYTSAYVDGFVGRFLNDTLLCILSSDLDLTFATILPSGHIDGQVFLPNIRFINISTCDSHVFALSRDGLLYHLAPQTVGVEHPAVAQQGFAMCIAPQPAHDAIRIRLNKAAPGGIHLRVYSVFGALVAERTDILDGTEDIVLQTVGLPSGIYIARIDGPWIALSSRFLVSH